MEAELDKNKIPKHIAIIMDGNGRWAKKRLSPKSFGHRAGAQTLRKLAENADDLGVKILTVYAFSTENWNRSKEEVDYLMNLLREYIQQYIDDREKNDMKISIIGNREGLDKDLREKIAYLEMLTKNKQGMNVVIALNYGGRDEIIRAVQKLCRELLHCEDAMNRIDDLNEDIFTSFLDTTGLPEPELLIRTSGEQRISNFLLWQSAYTELYFTDKLWPDFTVKDLTDAILAYQQRERRFGGRSV